MTPAPFPVIAGFTLRPVDPEADLNQIAALEKAVFVNDAWSRETWSQELANAFTWYVVVVAVDDPATVLGYAGLLSLPGSTDADVQTIALAPATRGSGLGRELMRQLHEEARRRGVTDVFLDVRVDNERAQNLYHSYGYTDIGIRKGYYQPDDVDAIVMQLRLSDPASGPASGPGPVGSEAVG